MLDRHRLGAVDGPALQANDTLRPQHAHTQPARPCASPPATSAIMPSQVARPGAEGLGAL